MQDLQVEGTCIWQDHRVSEAGETIIVKLIETEPDYYEIHRCVDGKWVPSTMGPDRERLIEQAQSTLDCQTRKEWSKARNEWVESFPDHLKPLAREYQERSVAVAIGECGDNAELRDMVPQHKERLAEITVELGLGTKEPADLTSTGEAIADTLKSMAGGAA